MSESLGNSSGQWSCTTSLTLEPGAADAVVAYLQAREPARFDIGFDADHGVTDALQLPPKEGAEALEVSFSFDERTRVWMRSPAGERLSWAPVSVVVGRCVEVR
jgi:hypothetical protein